MSLTPFALDTRPGHTALTIDGTVIDDPAAVTLQAAAGQVPLLTVHTTADGSITGEGIVQAVREPTPEEIHAAVLDVLTNVDVTALEALCQAKVQAGRRDPYRVAVETLVEMARG